MSDTETPDPQYKAPPLGAYPVEEHRAAQINQTFPEGGGANAGKPLHPEGGKVDEPADEPTEETPASEQS